MTKTKETPNTTSLDQMIWGRQYAQEAGEDFHAGALRVGHGVAQDPTDAARYADLIINKHFIPGGRILAGAGSSHGNLLNCFVQDSRPFDDNTTEGALHLAKKLALVTKVGGGNGVNLDPIPGKRTYAGPIGRAYLTIDQGHDDYEKVRDGTYMDLVIGQYVTKPYQHLAFVEPDSVLTLDARIDMLDSVEGIWDAAGEMVQALLRGENVLIDISALRSEGAPVAGSGGTSSGPSSFSVEILENFARWASLGGAEHAGPIATLRYVYAPTLRAIRQAGVRRGAGMATLSATHADLLDFITAKDNDREEAEGKIDTFNISVLASNAFMREATTRPNSIERKNLDHIANHAWESGEPGIIFEDTINLHNPLAKIDGPIKATNPCVTGDTPILTSTGIRTIEELALAGRDVLVWCVEPKTRDMHLRVMRAPRRTRENTPVLAVTFDSGLTLRCTPDHNLFTLAGDKVQAQALKPGDSILAYGEDQALHHTITPEAARLTAPAINHKVVSVQDAGHADVYNGTVDEHHTYLIPDQDGLGGIVSANCGEIPLTPGEPCDLGAINLAAHLTGSTLDRPMLEDTTRTAVRFLDDVLTAEVAPLNEIHDAIQDKRRIGLGLMGLADMLIRMGLRYDSDEGRAAVNDAVAIIREVALDESHRLATQRGVPAGVARAGLERRNIAVFTVAPTGTTSMLAGVSGGVEPVFAATYNRKIGTQYVKVVHPILESILEELDPAEHVNAGGNSTFIAADDDGNLAWDQDALVDALNEHHGSLQPLLDHLPNDARLSAYVIAHDIAYKDHVLMQATIQRAFDWVSDDAWRAGDESGMTLAGNSLSKTINMPNSAIISDVLEAYKLAWSEGCKGITVYRDGSRDMQVLTTSGKTVKKTDSASKPAPAPSANGKATTPSTNGQAAPAPAPLKAYQRKSRMHGVTDQVRLADGDGNQRGFFITVNSNGNHDPREVFIISGKGGDEANGDSEALGRVVSIALQYGVPPEALIKTLRGISGGMFGTYQGRIVTSKADLIAVALETANQVTDDEDAPAPAKASAQAPGTNAKACPQCGGPLHRSEGCLTCQNVDCLFSKCG